MSETKHLPVICIGGGPAGLTASYLLSKRGCPVTVLEKDPHYVGGIARTENYKGYRVDIGGHRFFSKSEEVNELWDELLGDDLIRRPRKSRIYYRGNFFSYPLQAFETLWSLGIIESGLCVLSHLRYKFFPIKNPRSFEEWVTNQFGARLYRIFFKTYTEKVWGMPCSQISADWAAQRIKGLSLSKAIYSAFFGQRHKKGSRVIKTLIHEFKYPRLGPGMMWEAAARKTQEQGGKAVMGAEVIALSYDAARPAHERWHVFFRQQDGTEQVVMGGHVLSTMPMAQLFTAIRQPAFPPEVLQSARSLRYRDFLVVGLVVRDPGLFDDNWLYIHDPGLKVGRIQNFKSWSPELIADPANTCLGLEYFCFEGDGLWSSSDADLIALAKREIQQLGLVPEQDVLDGFVIRQHKAYPVYDDDYKAHVQQLREAVEKHCPGLILIGRNGMHRYNNQDHAMMTAMLAVRNILDGAHYDLWEVNEDAEYHEESKETGNAGASGLRAVPQRID